MPNDLIIALIAGFGGMIGWGLSDFFAKKSLEKVEPFALTFWLQVAGILPILIFIIARGDIPVLSVITIFYVICFGLAEAVSDILMYKGFSMGNVSILSPVFASYAGLVVIFSALFFGEIIPGYVAWSLLIILAGVILINIDIRDIGAIIRRHKTATLGEGVPHVLGATFIYALWLVLYDQLVSGQDGVFLLLLVRSVEVVWLLGFAFVGKKSFKIARGQKLWPYVALVGLTDVIAYTFTTVGFSSTSYTSIVAVLGATFSLPTLVLARIFLKEKITWSQGIAIGLILIGVVMVVML